MFKKLYTLYLKKATPRINVATLKNKRLFFLVIFLALMLILGSGLRLWNLSEQSYWMDEGYTVNAVISVLEKGSTTLDSGQYYSCPTYCYPTASIVELLGDSPANYRLLSALAGIVFIGLFFFIVRHLLTTQIAFLTTFFITFSYWQIAWSRQARWYTLFALFFWLALYFFYKARQNGQNTIRNYIFTTIFTVLAIFTHGLGYLLPIIFIAWTIVDRFLFKKDLTKSTIAVFVGLSAVLLAIAEYQIGLVSNISLHYQLPYYLSFYLRTYWLFIGLGVFGFFSLYQTYKKAYLFLFTILLSYLIPLAFLTDIVHYRYLFHITPIFFIFGAIGIIAVYREINPLWARNVLLATILALFMTIGGGIIIPQTNYFLESDSPTTLGTRPHYAYTPQPDWQNAYTFIKANKTPSDIIISSHPHFNKIYLDEPGYWLAYNYLGFDDRSEYSHDDREFYVGAKIINDLNELRAITGTNKGFLIYDFMAADGRLTEDVLTYIETNFDLVYQEETNPFSQIWVYRF